LITEWGGQVQNNIDVDTDFVVMGAEPKIEQFTADELNDPLNKQIQDDQKAAYDAYQDQLEKAEKLGIPIMNQNRFLYFCGYYNSAQQ
jgi:NAD-dependent DNA ligase